MPRCLWDHNNYVPNGVFVPYYVDPALVSGIIDGAAETVEMTVDLMVVLDCFKPTSFNAWLDNCKEKRAQIIDLLKSLRDLLKKETLEQIFKDFKEYVSETAGFDNQARYNQGKLLFDVLAAYFGITEIKATLKGGNLVTIVSETLKKIPKDAIKIVTSTQKITSKTAKEIVQEVGKIVKNNSKLVKNLNLGKFIKKIGDYEVFENGEVFYRAIPQNQLDDLIKTGKIQAGTETFTSPTLKYIKETGYEGVIIKFHMKKGTIDKLKAIGTAKRTDAIKIEKYFGKMPINQKGWLQNNTLFKVEGTDKGIPQINIGLGRDKGLETFNNNIIGFEIIK